MCDAFDQLEGLGGDLYISGHKSLNTFGTMTMKPAHIKQLCGNNIVQVSCCANQTIAVTRRGAVYTWGEGSLTATQGPRQVVLLHGKRVIDSACDKGLALFITDQGELLSWAISSPEDAAVLHPTTIDLGVRIRRVCCGDGFCIALSEYGAVFSWGDPSFGKLGLGPAYARRVVTVPVRIESLDGVEIETAAAGKDHVLAVSITGDLYAWGSNQFLQCGMDCEPSIFDPRKVTGTWIMEWRTVKAVACGLYHSLVLDTAGYVWSAGKDDFGQLGRGPQRSSTIVNRSVFVASAIGVGGHFVSNTNSSGGGGGSSSGGGGSGGSGNVLSSSVGTSNLSYCSTPTAAASSSFNPADMLLTSSGEVEAGEWEFHEIEGLSNVTAIAAGGNHCIAIRLHDVYAWGCSSYGALGLNDSGVIHHTPERVSALKGVPVCLAACSSHHTVFGTFEAKEVISDMIFDRRMEYTQWLSPIRVFCTTYNTAETRPPAGPSMASWLNTDPPADIYAIGLQEIDMSAGAVLVGESAGRARDWESALFKFLPLKGKYYENLGSKNLVGIQLCLFVKKTLRPYVKDLTWYWKGVGLMGKMGNKGGVAASFTVFDSSFFVINSHFAAGDKFVRRRNENYCELAATLPSCNPTGAAAEKRKDKVTSIFDSDFVFWVGDFNYRLNMPYENVMEGIRCRQWNILLKYDQLLKEQAEGSTFVGWNEGLIEFAPTYAYDAGFDQYDTVRLRKPAWCDRVLWWSAEESSCCLLNYRRHEVQTSDHRPTSGLFSVAPFRVDECGKNMVAQEVQQNVMDLIKLVTEHGSSDSSKIHKKLNMSLTPADSAVSRLVEATTKARAELQARGSYSNTARPDEVSEVVNEIDAAAMKRRVRRIGSKTIGSEMEMISEVSGGNGNFSKDGDGVVMRVDTLREEENSRPRANTAPVKTGMRSRLRSRLTAADTTAIATLILKDKGETEGEEQRDVKEEGKKLEKEEEEEEEKAEHEIVKEAIVEQEEEEEEEEENEEGMDDNDGEVFEGIVRPTVRKFERINELAILEENRMAQLKHHVDNSDDGGSDDNDNDNDGDENEPNDINEKEIEPPSPPPQQQEQEEEEITVATQINQ